MSKTEADLDRAAAAYWLSVAHYDGAGRSAALNRAADLLRDARTEAREPDRMWRPHLNEGDEPQLNRPWTRRLTR